MSKENKHPHLELGLVTAPDGMPKRKGEFLHASTLKSPKSWRVPSCRKYHTTVGGVCLFVSLHMHAYLDQMHAWICFSRAIMHYACSLHAEVPRLCCKLLHLEEFLKRAEKNEFGAEIQEYAIACMNSHKIQITNTVGLDEEFTWCMIASYIGPYTGVHISLGVISAHLSMISRERNQQEKRWKAICYIWLQHLASVTKYEHHSCSFHWLNHPHPYCSFFTTFELAPVYITMR